MSHHEQGGRFETEEKQPECLTATAEDGHEIRVVRIPARLSPLFSFFLGSRNMNIHLQQRRDALRTIIKNIFRHKLADKEAEELKHARMTQSDCDAFLHLLDFLFQTSEISTIGFRYLRVPSGSDATLSDLVTTGGKDPSSEWTHIDPNYQGGYGEKFLDQATLGKANALIIYDTSRLEARATIRDNFGKGYEWTQFKPAAHQNLSSAVLGILLPSK